MREWRKTHVMSAEERTKDRARAYANTYQRRGKLLPQPCRLCGSPRSLKHHNDYANPLDVDWLCRRCGRALRKLRKALVAQFLHARAAPGADQGEVLRRFLEEIQETLPRPLPS